MSRVTIDVYEPDDLDGDPVATFTDADIGPGPLWRDGENELGTVGPLALRRDHPNFAALAKGNYVVIDVAGAEPFGGWLDEVTDVVLGANEEADEVRVAGGPGVLAILRHAMLLDDLHAPAPPASKFRGNYDVEGKWTWEGEPFGAILTRCIEEGQNQPGEPLDVITIDFDRTDDTNSDPWPEFTGIVEMEIGTDVLAAYGTLIETGQLYVRPEADFSVHAYGTRDYGTDRTSATFGTGKVRFVKGVNIIGELERQVGDSSAVRLARRGTPTGSLPRRGTGRGGPAGVLGHSPERGVPAGALMSLEARASGGARRGPTSTLATHALVQGKDYTYRQVVASGYVSGKGRWTRVPYQESNDTDLLDGVGGEALRRAEMTADALVFEIVPGDDEAAGYYTPTEHFAIGDIVTVHTGTGTNDFNQADARVTGITCVLGDVSRDDDTDPAVEARSIRWYVELNGSPTRSSVGSPAASIGCCGCSHGSAVPDTDPPAFLSEVYHGDLKPEGTAGVYVFTDRGSSTVLAFVPGSEVVFDAGVAIEPDDIDGPAGTVDIASHSGTLTMMARVACTGHYPYFPPT